MTDQFLTLWPLIQRRAKAIRRRCDLVEAKDLAQAAALRVWKELPTYEPARAKLTTWAWYVIESSMKDAIRQFGSMIGDHRRGKRKGKRVDLPAIVRNGQDHTELFDPAAARAAEQRAGRESFDDLLTHIRDDDERLRLICHQRFADDEQMKSIGARFGVSPSRVTQLLQAAFEKLRMVIRAEGVHVRA